MNMAMTTTFPNVTSNNTEYDIDGVTTDTYIYDYNSSINDYPPGLVPNALGYGVTLVLGLIGNTLVIISVARYRSMQNVTNIFLLSLASADLLLLLICLPVKLAKFFTFTWAFGEILCKGVHYLQNVVIICSVANLTGLSLERYYAILHPMRAKYTCTVALARRTVMVLWVISIMMGVPTLVGQQHLLVGVERQAYWCLERWEKPLYHQLYQVYMFFLIFLLPLSLMTFAYASICRKLWLVRYHRASMRANNLRYCYQETILLETNTPNGAIRGDKVVPGTFTVKRKKTCSVDEDSTRKQVIKMLVAVIVLFAVCWGPIMINNLLVAFGVLEYLHVGYLKPMRQVFWLMSYFNSCVNPIVYGFMSKNFRDTFRYTIGICCVKHSPKRNIRFQGRCSLPVPSSGQSTSHRVTSIFRASDKNNRSRKPQVSFSHGSPCSELTDIRKDSDLKIPFETNHMCEISDVCNVP